MALTITQIAEAWIAAGGNTGEQTVEAVAVALAESGGDPYAVSPSNDYGVWQINAPTWDTTFGYFWTRWSIPKYSAHMAIVISGNGTNWAPWCTAWADPSNCGHGYLSVPQPTSPAGKKLALVASVLGENMPTIHTLDDPSTGPGVGKWANVHHLFGAGGVQWHNRLAASRAAARRI